MSFMLGNGAKFYGADDTLHNPSFYAFRLSNVLVLLKRVIFRQECDINVWFAKKYNTDK